MVVNVTTGNIRSLDNTVRESLGSVTKTCDDVINTLYGDFKLNVKFIDNSDSYLFSAKKIVQSESILNDEFGTRKVVSMSAFHNASDDKPTFSISYMVGNEARLNSTPVVHPDGTPVVHPDGTPNVSIYASDDEEEDFFPEDKKKNKSDLETKKRKSSFS